MNKDNSGALFGTKDKKTDKHPDYSGEAIINGIPMKIAGWRKTSASGLAYLSLAFQTKEAKEVDTPRKGSKEPAEDIPF